MSEARRQVQWWRVCALGGALAAVGAGIGAPSAGATATSGPSYGAAQTFGTFPAMPAGVAVAPNGTVYVALDGDSGSGVVKVAPNGKRTTIAHMADPGALAVDLAGDVYAVDGDDDTVVEITPGGAQTTVVSGGFFPRGVAVDPAGDLFTGQSYVPSGGGPRVDEYAANGTQSQLGSFADPTALALAPDGDLLVADNGDDTIQQLAGGAQSTLASGFGDITGVAVDPAGDVVASDNGTNTADAVSPSGTSTPIASGLANPEAIATDAAGNVYVADSFSDSVVEIPYSANPGTTRSRVTLKCAAPTAAQLQKVTAGTPVSVKCTAKVAPARPPAASPTGTLSFTATPSADGGESLSASSCTLSGQDVCTTKLTTATPDRYTVTARYNGDATYASSGAQAPVNLTAAP